MRFLNLVITILQQLLDDVLDILADIAGFGERSRIGNHEGNVEQSRQGLREKRLARASRAHQQNVALGEFNFVAFADVFQALVVVVHRHRQDSLGGFLPNHIGIKDAADFLRRGQIGFGGFAWFHTGSLITNDVIAQLDAFVTNEHRGPGNELADLVLALAAKRAIEQLFATGFFVRH